MVNAIEKYLLIPSLTYASATQIEAAIKSWSERSGDDMIDFDGTKSKVELVVRPSSINQITSTWTRFIDDKTTATLTCVTSLSEIKQKWHIDSINCDGSLIPILAAPIASANGNIKSDLPRATIDLLAQTISERGGTPGTIRRSIENIDKISKVWTLPTNGDQKIVVSDAQDEWMTFFEALNISQYSHKMSVKWTQRRAIPDPNKPEISDGDPHHPRMVPNLVSTIYGVPASAAMLTMICDITFTEARYLTKIDCGKTSLISPSPPVYPTLNADPNNPSPPSRTPEPSKPFMVLDPTAATPAATPNPNPEAPPVRKPPKITIQRD